MKTHTLTAIIISAAIVALGQNYATKIRAEFQTAGVESLRDLEWLQGTTPLISVDPVDNGRPIKADADMTVRMVIGASPESTLFAFAEASVATNNSYFIQWPTIGTNTVDGAWWYTVYFEKDGRRYWTGDGELYISPTTSTGDGVHWQEVTAGTESDPIALPVINAHLADSDNPHGVTTEQIGAIPGELKENGHFWAPTELDGIGSWWNENSCTWMSGEMIHMIHYGTYSYIDANGFLWANGRGAARWPDTPTYSPLIKRDELAQTNTLLQAAISLKADKSYVDGKVKTDVPANAKFTDTIIDISGKADKADVAAGTNWLYRAGLTGTVAFANAGNRPQAWSGSGDLIVTEISGLAPPAQVYWTLQGFSSVTLPAGVYAVGGGTLQAGMVNHFAVWQVGDTTMITFLTATEIE